MKTTQIQFDGVGQLRYIERELPELKDDQVLVKVEAVGLCTWERHIFSGSESMPFPFVGGHEIAGKILEVGKVVSDGLRPGMAVSVAKWVRCNECEPCRRGMDNHCEANFRDNGKEYSGPAGFAEYLVANSYEVFPFAENAPIHYAALAEPVACVTRGINRMHDLRAGDTVVVVGAGIMGLLFLKLLRLRGMRVIVVQRSEERRKLAAQMGAEVIDPTTCDWVRRVIEMTNGRGPAGVVYTAGGGKVANECLEAVKLGGHVLIYAPTLETEPALETDLIHFKEIQVTGALRHDKESFRQAVQVLGSGLVDFSDLKLEFGDFRKLEEEMKRADTDKSIHRILLRW